ncbi:hypothetical protein B0T26DRAFT_657334 [Lasiosphaeria miniovina]|uniref:DUF7719 domain-containing protein n=1 Tax=Lasiosphaeria miniovina TaxID=1954250 RepID=A0AA39ZUM8_9PEZI|nr:uncharacterized protein B0T26DRAFT_657334 [Lasiosphaeria miniovina]KAK0703856.1 hypothetical protein B0T26DRAFT_657334 [Lasiosphaeria miniovina]
MAKKRGDRSPNLKLRQPDRSGPSTKTLLELAEERDLFVLAKNKEDANKKAKRAETHGESIQRGGEDGDDGDDDGAELSPTTERILDTILWTISLAMLHFTLDVLVQHQFSADRVVWAKVWTRAGQALLVFAMLFYPLHPHPSNPSILPGLPKRVQPIIRQSIFFVASICAGCYLIHITNTYGYMAVMKRAPPVGCLWVWSVIELDLPWAVLSLASAGSFLLLKGYSIR